MLKPIALLISMQVSLLNKGNNQPVMITGFKFLLSQGWVFIFFFLEANFYNCSNLYQADVYAR